MNTTTQTNDADGGATALSAAERWNEILGPYMGADDRRSAIELAGTAAAFIVLWYAAYRSLEVGYWLTLLLAVPTAGFMMRLFMIQHDCGHGSFFRSKTAATVTGFLIGVVMLTPYQYWRKAHAHHHAHSGDLDFRGFGDIHTMTVREYRASSRFGRLRYRLYRNPLVLFGIGPIYHFVFKHRFPWDIPRSWKTAWRSVWWTNAAVAGVLALAWATIGLGALLRVQAPITLIASVLGVWMFYVQHQFEDTYWHDHENWDYFEAGLHGSTHLALPAPLQWITASIGLHHVHHLSARIPNYRLYKAHLENPELQTATRITIRDGMRTVPLTLWDERARRLIRFRDLKARAA